MVPGIEIVPTVGEAFGENLVIGLFRAFEDRELGVEASEHPANPVMFLEEGLEGIAPDVASRGAPTGGSTAPPGHAASCAGACAGWGADSCQAGMPTASPAGAARMRATRTCHSAAKRACSSSPAWPETNLEKTEPISGSGGIVD